LSRECVAPVAKKTFRGEDVAEALGRVGETRLYRR
jgi:hypothetical protein